jgi:SpoVK/Ycf46/Vps4 family AAA+-type ATPase
LSIQEVFGQARKSAPCVLVLEDLDALITKRNRSHFLNELDGFARNDGILTLATSNHPQKLDPAIVDRPSRFDRKFLFDLPARPERRRFLTGWNVRLEAPMRASNETLAGVADAAEGFSFAYLKELCMAALMRWMSMPCEGAMNDILPEQVMHLRAQMHTSGKKRQEKTTTVAEPAGSAR